MAITSHLVRYPKDQTPEERKAKKPLEWIEFMQECDPDVPCLPRGVKQTSKDAYYKFKASGKLNAQQTLIHDYLSEHGGSWTRAELSDAMGLKINVICPRIFELLEMNVLKELPRRKCKTSNEMAHPVELI